MANQNIKGTPVLVKSFYLNKIPFARQASITDSLCLIAGDESQKWFDSILVFQYPIHSRGVKTGRLSVPFHLCWTQMTVLKPRRGKKCEGNLKFCFKGSIINLQEELEKNWLILLLRVNATDCNLSLNSCQAIFLII